MAIEAPIPRDRIPPQSLEMEQAFLGSILVDATPMGPASEFLKVEDFYRDTHRLIYEAILALHERNSAIDLLTVQEQLRIMGKLEQVGGAPYLVQLTNATPTSENAVYYARVVHEKAILRQLLSASSKIQSLAHSDYDDIRQVVDQAEQAVFQVAAERDTRNFVPMPVLVNEVYSALETLSNQPSMTTGLRTPFHRLNWMTAGLQASDLIIIAARPSMGKTSLALGMGQYAAIHERAAVAVFSLEMSKEQLCMRMICSEARVDAQRVRTGSLNHEEWSRLGLACGLLHDAPIYIDDTPDISVLEMRGKLRRLSSEVPLALVIVDYLQLVRSNKRIENRTQEIGEIARSLKALARDMKVPVIALSQLSRAVEHRQKKKPMLSDLRESGSIEAEADLVIFIYREEYYKELEAGEETGTDEERAPEPEKPVQEIELIVAKQRNGPTGVVKVAFTPRFARFDDLAPAGVEDR